MIENLSRLNNWKFKIENSIQNCNSFEQQESIEVWISVKLSLGTKQTPTQSHVKSLYWDMLIPLQSSSNQHE